jgi:hypothetical protein
MIDDNNKYTSKMKVIYKEANDDFDEEEKSNVSDSSILPDRDIIVDLEEEIIDDNVEEDFFISGLDDNGEVKFTLVNRPKTLSLKFFPYESGPKNLPDEISPGSLFSLFFCDKIFEEITNQTNI